MDWYFKLGICCGIILAITIILNPSVLFEDNIGFVLTQSIVYGLLLYGGYEAGLNSYYRKKYKKEQRTIKK